MKEASDLKKAKGLPLWTALLGLLLVAVLALGAVGYLFYRATNDKATLERKLQAWEAEKANAEINKQKAAEDAKLALARTRQMDCLLLIRSATNSVGSLWQSLERVKNEAAALGTNEVGRNVARHPDLVALARRLYEIELRELPQREVVIAKLEGLRRFEHQLVGAAGTAYEPDSSIATSVQSDAFWAAQEAHKVERVTKVIATLTQEATVKIPPTGTAKPMTLGEAVAELAQADAALRQRLIAEKTTQATLQATETVGTAEAARILKAAELEAAKILESAKDQARKQEQEMAVRDAQRKIQDANTQVAVNKAGQEAEKVKLHEKASDPAILAKLTPFLAPGYLQLGSEKFTTEKLPFRWKEFVSQDLISGSERSLNNLVQLATSEQDRTRPRWRLKVNKSFGWKKDTADFERVVEAQKLLRELGPTFVELGKLRP